MRRCARYAVKDFPTKFNMNCKDCRFFVPGLYPETGFCKRFYVYRGRGKIVHEFASQARLELSKCGPRAKFFVSKNEKHISFLNKDDDEDDM